MLTTQRTSSKNKLRVPPCGRCVRLYLSRSWRVTLIQTMLDRITFDPLVMGGRACIRGMRITVAQLVNLVANGMAVEEILREYPDLQADDIRQAVLADSLIRGAAGRLRRHAHAALR